MTQRRGLLSNSLALAAGNASASLLGLLFTATFARTLGARGLGEFQFAASIASIGSLLACLGLDVLLVREVAKDRARAVPLLHASLALKSAIILPVLGGAALLAAWRYGGAQGQLMLVVTGAALLEALAASFTSIFRGIERMEREAAVLIAGSLVGALAGTAALASGLGVVEAVTCWSLGGAVKLAAAALICSRGAGMPGLTGRLRLKEGMSGLIAPSVACGALALIGVVYSNADVIMLRELAGESEVGWYTAATKLTAVVLYLPSILVAGLFPVLSRESANRQEARRCYGRAYYSLLLMGMPAGAGAAVIAGPMVQAVYGEGFEQAATALLLLAPYLGWYFINLVNGASLVAFGRQGTLALGTGIATVFNVAGNAYAIPRFGVPGACAVTVSASGAGALLYTALCHRHVGLSFRWGVALRGAAATAVMAAAASWLLRAGAGLVVVVPAAAAIYLAGLAVTGCLGTLAGAARPGWPFRFLEERRA